MAEPKEDRRRVSGGRVGDLRHSAKATRRTQAGSCGDAGFADGFANERSGLEKQWDSGDNVSTEDFRLAQQRYRSFFDSSLKL